MKARIPKNKSPVYNIRIYKKMHTPKSVGGGCTRAAVPTSPNHIKKTHIVYRQGDMKFLRDLPLTKIGC